MVFHGGRHSFGRSGAGMSVRRGTLRGSGWDGVVEDDVNRCPRGVHGVLVYRYRQFCER